VNLGDLEKECSLEIDVDAQKMGNEMRFINSSSPDCNLEINATMKTVWCEGNLCVLVVAKKDIKAGQEVIVDYGDDYFEEMHPESCSVYAGIVAKPVQKVLQEKKFFTDLKKKKMEENKHLFHGACHSSPPSKSPKPSPSSNIRINSNNINGMKKSKSPEKNQRKSDNQDKRHSLPKQTEKKKFVKSTPPKIAKNSIDELLIIPKKESPIQTIQTEARQRIIRKRKSETDLKKKISSTESSSEEEKRPPTPPPAPRILAKTISPPEVFEIHSSNDEQKAKEELKKKFLSRFSSPEMVLSTSPKKKGITEKRRKVFASPTLQRNGTLDLFLKKEGREIVFAEPKKTKPRQSIDLTVTQEKDVVKEVTRKKPPRDIPEKKKIYQRINDVGEWLLG
jgi:hypothetical protein